MIKLTCPYFNSVCIGSKCMAYEKSEIYVGPSSDNDQSHWGLTFKRGDCIYRIMEYCHILKIEIPQRQEDSE